MTHNTFHSFSVRYRLLFTCSVLMLLFLVSVPIHAQDSGKTVRVGWYESSFNITYPSGIRTGYAYEYQQKLAAYTGWHYEYVNGSWPELMEKLAAGEIDLLSDVSCSEERDLQVLFSSLPMGTEEYYLFIAPDNKEILADDYSTLDGKRVGINKGSVQIDMYQDWAREHALETEIIEVTSSEEDTLKMLLSGDLDAYVTVDSFANTASVIPLHKIGSSDFYFAVNSARPDLLEDLNKAMSRLQDENRFYNQEMYNRYFNPAGSGSWLSQEEESWLSGHGPIRVGYQDDYLAFCAQDKETGELTGVLRDYLTYSADCLKDARLEFEAVPYPSSLAAMKALAKGEIDCVFPANLNSHESEQQGLIMTPALIRTDIYAIVRQADLSMFSQKEHVIVAVNENNPNYDAFLREHFPDWRKVYYPGTDSCLKAVSDRVADCVLISNYRFNNLSRLCDKFNLTTYSTGVGLDYCFAVNAGNTELYSILARTSGLIPDSTLNAAMSRYITEEARLSVTDFIEDHLPVVMAVTALVLVVILYLLVQNMRAKRRAQSLISATETDDLTGLYNRKFFFQYADRMYRDHPDQPMDAIVLNIEQFHSVNALNGRDFGDQVLYALGSEIREIAAGTGGIAGRFEADRFDIYCRHLNEYQTIFDRLQKKLDDLSPHTNIRLRMGVMAWQAGLEPVQLFDRARTACSMARGHYKEHLIIYDADVGQREMYDQRLVNDLRRALEEHEFEVYYQPQFDIQTEPPRLVGAEALVRWKHPELGMIPPGDFIPLFESNGHISSVDRYVWEEAARQVARWRDSYGVRIPVSVNLSRVDVFDPNLEGILDGILAAYGLDCKDIHLEVTESAYTENAEQVIQVVANLRGKGYEVEMDDFGSGYSSLNMLSTMPIDVLKMDRGFIMNIEHDEKDIQLVALILGTAGNLNIPVIAEGAETAEQVQILKSLGCAQVQGYYFSRPLPPADFEKKYFNRYD